MASLINPNNIDGSYPVAGQDNNSQGFRDNFTNIRTNFGYAKNEINALQSNTVQTGSNVTNNLSGAVIANGIVQNLATSIETLSATGNANISVTTTCFATTGNVTANLAAGTSGLVKVFAMGNTSASNVTVVVTGPAWTGNATGNISLTAKGQGCTLQYLNSKWFCVGNNGASFS